MKIRKMALLSLASLLFTACEKENLNPESQPTGNTEENYSNKVKVYDESGEHYVLMELSSNDKAVLQEFTTLYSGTTLELFTEKPTTTEPVMTDEMKAGQTVLQNAPVELPGGDEPVREINVKILERHTGNALGFQLHFPTQVQNKTATQYAGFSMLTVDIGWCSFLYAKLNAPSYATANLYTKTGGGGTTWEFAETATIYNGIENYFGVGGYAPRKIIITRPGFISAWIGPW